METQLICEVVKLIFLKKLAIAILLQPIIAEMSLSTVKPCYLYFQFFSPLGTLTFDHRNDETQIHTIVKVITLEV